MSDFRNENVWLMKGDCLERMKEIPDGSVDLVLTDPPYNNVKKIYWDSQWGDDENFLTWFDQITKELDRVCKPTASLFIFCKPAIAPKLALTLGKSFNFQSDIVWKKKFYNKGQEGWKNKCKKQSLRRPYPSSERILFHTRENYPYVIKNARLSKNFSLKELTGLLGAYKNVNNGGQVSNWEAGRNYPPTRFIKDLELILGVSIPPKRKYDATALENFEDVLEYYIVPPTENIHTCQKPINLLEDLIKATTYKGDTILDFTFGSGSTIKAAHNLNRKAIGIENGYCEKKGHKYEGVHWVDVLKDDMGFVSKSDKMA